MHWSRGVDDEAGRRSGAPVRRRFDATPRGAGQAESANVSRSRCCQTNALRRAALGARRSGGVRPGKLRRGPRERLDARNRAGRRVRRDGEFRAWRRRCEESSRGRAATVDARTGVMIVAGRRRMIGARGRRRSEMTMRGMRRARSADHAWLDRLPAERCDDRAPGAVHRARLQQSRLPRDERKPDGEQSRQGSEPGLAAMHDR